MRFLIDANLPRSTAVLLSSYGHDAVDVRDIGLRSAQDSEIAAYARQLSLCIITRDFDFSDIRFYPPGEYHGLVVLYVPGNITYRQILNLVEEFLQQPELLDTIEGKLAIVEPGRIRLRSE